MEICENKLKNSISKIIILVLLFFGSGYQMQYAIDTYYLFIVGIDTEASGMLFRNGRLTISILYKLFSLTHLPDEYLYYISFAIALVALVAAVYLYNKVLSAYIENENLRIILSFLVIANLYIVEYFMFIEKGCFIIGIFFNVLAVYHVKKYITERTKKSIAFAILAELGACLTYQGTIALFFILSMPIIFREAKNVIEYIKSFLLLVVVYWAAVGLDMVFISLVCTDERNGRGSLTYGINKAIDAIKMTYTSIFELIPKYSYLILLLIALVSSMAAIVAYKKSWLNVANIVLMLIVTSILPSAPIIITVSWIPPRLIYPMASTVGILVVNYFVNILPESELGVKKTGIKRLVSVGVITVICCLTLAEYVAVVGTNNDKYKANFADRVRILEIGEAIHEHEAATGYKIKQIAFYRDANHDEHEYYPGVNDWADLVISSFHNPDSQLRAINYVLGTSYAPVPEDKAYQEYFANFDWHTHSPMQIICDKDTLHYCVY